MPSSALISGFVEQTLNLWLEQSHSTKECPAHLMNRQIGVKLTDINLPLAFAINEKGYVSVIGNVDSVDCLILTSVFTLKKLENSHLITKLIKQGELDIEGDVQLAQQFADWLKSSLAKWQAVLATIVGDIASYKIINAGEQISGKIQQRINADQHAFLNAAWYEKKILPHPNEMQNFSQQVTKLRQDTDRLNAKIQHLIQTLQ